MLKTVGIVLAIVLALGQTGERAPTPRKHALWAAISVEQPIIARNTETTQVYFGLVNDGDSTVDPKVELSHLLINGVEPKDWSFVIGNGLRNPSFNALPPGHSWLFTYQLGRYFLAPGVYTVRWESDNFRSPDLTFRVVTSLQ